MDGQSFILHQQNGSETQSFGLHQQNVSETQHYRVAVWMDGQPFSLHQQNGSETVPYRVAVWMDGQSLSLHQQNGSETLQNCCGVCGWMDSHLASIIRIGQRHSTTELLWCVLMDGHHAILTVRNNSKQTIHTRTLPSTLAASL